MIKVAFAKWHGAENDFLLTWRHEVSAAASYSEIARRICARTTGIGADGWMLLEHSGSTLRTVLFNSDGSQPEISGNGTRCAAAYALWQGVFSGPQVMVSTGAGEKQLVLLARDGRRFELEMDMGRPQWSESGLHTWLPAAGQQVETCLVNVGNPQCVVFVESLPAGWLTLAAAIEQHAVFPDRTNVSFVIPLSRNRIRAYFYERGAGETRSSGTGSTGAAIAAILRGIADSPVEVVTPAGPLHVRWDRSVFLTGPSEFIGEGVYFFAD